jgi:GNAT superfamily N-acetyltransferase
VQGDQEALYERQAATLVASWRAYAAGSPAATVVTADGVSAGIFPVGPERRVFNNALLERGMGAQRRTAAIAEMRHLYREAGIEQYAAWVHEADGGLVAQLASSDYRFDSSTRIMAMSLDALPPEPGIELGEGSWQECLRVMDLPEGLLEGVDPSAFHPLLARFDGRNVSTALAFDHHGDCGIYNVATVPEARRRGIGSAVTTVQLHLARERGCTTASLQSTEMAERVYALVGFRDLGRYFEFVPD